MNKDNDESIEKNDDQFPDLANNQFFSNFVIGDCNRFAYNCAYSCAADGTIQKNYDRIPKPVTEYTFNNFVVGDCNEFTYRSAYAFANYDSCASSLLFINSPIGNGKTHLLNAIWNHTNTLKSDLRIISTNGSVLMHDMMMHISEGKSSVFRRNLADGDFDIMLIDDIHGMKGKAGTIHEFLILLSEICNSRKRVAVTCGNPTEDLMNLERTAISNFNGTIANITKPDYEQRLSILKRAIQGYHYSLNTMQEGLLEYIAHKVDADPRKLESVLHTLFYRSRMTNEEISWELASKVINAYGESIVDFRELN